LSFERLESLIVPFVVLWQVTTRGDHTDSFCPPGFSGVGP
jgi:hypothetical protein